MAPSNTTPWWERKNADAQSRDGGGDACSIRSSETVRGARRDRSPRGIPPSSISSARSLGRPLDARPTPLAPRRPLIPRPQYSCRTAPDDNGVMRRKCERIVKKFRMCPGRCVRTVPPPDPFVALRQSTATRSSRRRSDRSRARGLRFLPALTLPSRPRRAAEPRRRSKTRARRRRKTPKAGSSAAGGPRPGNGVPRRAGAAQEDRRRSCRFRSACSSSSTTTRADRTRKKKRVGVAAAATRARTF